MLSPSGPALPHDPGSSPVSLFLETSMLIWVLKADQLAGRVPLRMLLERSRDRIEGVAVQLTWSRGPCKRLPARDKNVSLQGSSMVGDVTSNS